MQGKLSIIDVDGDRTVIWNPPIPNDDLEQIEGILRAEKIFVPTFPEEPYKAALYIQEEGFMDTKTLLLFDTNVFTRIVELTKGKQATKEHIVPAAVMCFASCARLLTLPAPSLYEEAMTRLGRDSNSDLACFQAGDNLDPQEWADIALGRRSCLQTKIEPVKQTKHKFRKPLQGFGFTYPFVLKLACLELAGGTRIYRFTQFIDWQYEHWLFSYPANLLAIRLFSANTPRKALKGLRSEDIKARRSGLHNAATDLAYAYAYFKFYKQMSEKNELTLFCTRDLLLREIVQDLRKGFEEHDALSKRIEEELGLDVLAHYRCLNKNLKNVNRKYRKNLIYTRRITSELEKALGI